VISPGFAVPVGKHHVALLLGGFHALSRGEIGVHSKAGTDAVWLTWIRADDAGVGRSMHRGKLTEGIKLRGKFSRGDEGLAGVRGSWLNSKLRRPEVSARKGACRQRRRNLPPRH